MHLCICAYSKIERVYIQATFTEQQQSLARSILLFRVILYTQITNHKAEKVNKYLIVNNNLIVGTS